MKQLPSHAQNWTDDPISLNKKDKTIFDRLAKFKAKLITITLLFHIKLRTGSWSIEEHNFIILSILFLRLENKANCIPNKSNVSNGILVSNVHERSKDFILIHTDFPETKGRLETQWYELIHFMVNEDSGHRTFMTLSNTLNFEISSIELSQGILPIEICITYSRKVLHVPT